ncbi:type VI secretion system ATPase TssH [Aquabacter spiritensis]|uniref:Type VI secretion system protein VasG n=1 Tax=Aquabacter spiritensis TaxID=933073 RepID=A0A4R3LRT7_9HYPH|nr:type VI secretion system ATPase TssH [Aquabacter spiritensis]TCT02476.1 type VI secretion system protein VasG [Aquabacter spiritensis]
MTPIDLKPLISRLNQVSRAGLENAAGFALMRTHYAVEVEHWLTKMLEDSTCDISVMMSLYGIDVGRVQLDISRSLDRLRSGNSRPPGLSPDIISATKEAWLLASIVSGLGQVRSGHLLWAMLADESLNLRLNDISSEFRALSVDALRKDFPAIMAKSGEQTSATLPGAGPAGASEPAAAGGRSGDALGQYTVDLTAEAKAGRIDPILGRDDEIRQIVDILIRRRQNNPILTGEAGVGKTAVVEGFALKIAAGDVPPALRDVCLRTLDLGLLQAGASMKGEFENRLRSVIDAVKASPVPIILFIDEAHNLVGAGGAAGQGDAANLLKPALARGELRTIAATTWAEYKKYFEKDAALTRRFQVVKVEEPSEPLAVAMLRGLVPVLEKFHKVRILDEAIGEAVRLSARYIPSRQLPDKGVSLLDTACARVAVSQTTIPGAIEDRERRVGRIDAELALLRREAAVGTANGGRRTALEDERAQLVEERAALDARWQEEKELVDRLQAIRTALETAPPEDDTDALKSEFTELHDRLHTVQGENPLVFPLVDGQAIAEVVQNWTGIPAGRMRSDEIRNVLALQETMERRIVGQSHAINAVVQAIRTSRAGLTDPRKPLGVFLMVGPSGVGKTETALTLAELLYGGEQNLTTINMSEFKEEHKVSLLMGSPPGYVGYGEGGILTEAVRRKPYSVILLDEMEKAHQGVQDVFFQVFDKGHMKDGEGRDIDFKNTIIIMTSNAASDLIAKLCADPDTAPEPHILAEALRPELMKYYKAAFLGRVTLVPYLPLTDEVIRKIVVLQMERIRRRVADAYEAVFDYDPALIETIAARCTESASGARNIENILSRTLLPEMSAEILQALAQEKPIERVTVGIGPDGQFTYSVA